MISLAIDVEPSPSPSPSLSAADPAPDPHAGDLRRDALWYPDVPTPALCLNQDAFFPAWARFVSQHQYKPLIWCHFGGPGGKYLPHLTRVVVTSGRGSRHIAFIFGGREDVPIECRSLGRLPIVGNGYHVVEFGVDGPGGERIEVVEIGHWLRGDGEGLRWETEQGVMVWFKVCFSPNPFSP